MEKTVTLTKKQFYEASAEAVAKMCAFAATIGYEKEAHILARLSAKTIEIISKELFEEGEE